MEFHWMSIYRAFRDLLITGAALIFLYIEISNEARTEVLLLIGSMLGVPAFLRSSTAIRNAATSGNKK